MEFNVAFIGFPGVLPSRADTYLLSFHRVAEVWGLAWPVHGHGRDSAAHIEGRVGVLFTLSLLKLLSNPPWMELL